MVWLKKNILMALSLTMSARTWLSNRYKLRYKVFSLETHRIASKISLASANSSQLRQWTVISKRIINLEIAVKQSGFSSQQSCQKFSDSNQKAYDFKETKREGCRYIEKSIRKRWLVSKQSNKSSDSYVLEYLMLACSQILIWLINYSKLIYFTSILYEDKFSINCL